MYDLDILTINFLSTATLFLETSYGNDYRQLKTLQGVRGDGVL